MKSVGWNIGAGLMKDVGTLQAIFSRETPHVAKIKRSGYSLPVERPLPAVLIDKTNSVKFKKMEKEESMRVYGNYGKVAILVAALVLMSFTSGIARTNVDYKFKVHNNTRHDIKKILVSDDGKKWGYFDIGDGIAAGDTEELVWDKSTDNGYCEWQFKAVFDNGEESEAVEFNFCEKNLVLEFK